MKTRKEPTCKLHQYDCTINHDKPQHTPTPWHIGTIDGSRMILSHQTYEIVRLSKYPSATEDRNAAFIVRAVNAHEKLLTEIRTLKFSLGRCMAGNLDAQEKKEILSMLAKAEGR